MQPRIAITLGATTKPAVIEQYRRFVVDGGGNPTVLLPGSDSRGAFDGLLLGGGADVHPREYGAPPEPLTVAEPERDAFERPFAESALRQGLPVLGICRGLQLLNVIYGGGLIQHLEGHSRDEDGRSRQHRASIAAGSRLASILGSPDVLVNSSHHQGVRGALLAPGLRAVGWSDHDLIEAVEADGPEWVLGVQWHPERVDEVDPANRHLAEAFVAAAAARSRVGAAQTG